MRTLDCGSMWPFKPKPQPPPRVPAKPTPEMHEEARRNPDGWVYVFDGTFSPNEAVPPERIIGAWKVDAAGKLTDEYKANPNYRGSAI